MKDKITIKNNTNQISNLVILFGKEYLNGKTVNVGYSGTVTPKVSVIIQELINKITKLVDKTNKELLDL